MAAGGDDHSLVVANGELWSFGEGDLGQLGHDDNSRSSDDGASTPWLTSIRIFPTFSFIDCFPHKVQWSIHTLLSYVRPNYRQGHLIPCSLVRGQRVDTKFILDATSSPRPVVSSGTGHTTGQLGANINK